MKAEIYKRTDGLWDFRFIAENGEGVATSGGQAFTERNDAAEAVARIVAGVMDPDFIVGYAETEESEQDIGGEG